MFIFFFFSPVPLVMQMINTSRLQKNPPKMVRAWSTLFKNKICILALFATSGIWAKLVEGKGKEKKMM